MDLIDRIKAFIKLGEKINALKSDEISQIALQAKNENPWFTKDNITLAFQGLTVLLHRENLNKWLDNYKIEVEVPRIVGVVMAGNIPLVGFHDLLCVLLTGHFAAVKTSSKDTFLIKLIIDWIITIEPGFKKNISLRERLNSIDAVIATGSDNSSRYFHHYFGKMPNIIRKNRVSIAVLDGHETEDELRELAKDIFSYYGLGCRNVSKLLYPAGFDIKKIFPHFESYKIVQDNHKYNNNYDYHKSIFLINSTPHLDTGFLLLKETEELVSPLSVIYAESYSDKKDLGQKIDLQKAKIQCIIGHDFIPFGQAQFPRPWDYADNIDTINFLISI